ncbi:ketoacyl-ACP synthase III [uncultured Prevotella sp.]|uniref:3-oxoacyl-ACP synthase III family protein n=1 Tax=uncultured Prevotella sp. TaxID=159272 RepID=UPI0025D11C11|nr:ketoacyl-ACP synthase III [uncultured Prevotella sp.]
MAFVEFKNVRIAGISAGVPKFVASNLHPLENDGISSDYSPEAFVEATGVLERHVSNSLTTSDLCFEAAEKLIADLGWDKKEIEALVFVSQTADYVLPATACILQDRLGLSRECYAEDIALGCSGWVYGLSNVASLVATGSIKKALLLAGDAKKRAKGSLDPLFGHAGTATAIEYSEGDNGFKFHFGTDGSGYDAIIMPDGGSRNQVSMKSFELEEVEGKQMHRLQTHMKGMDVFSFGITTAPKSVKKLAEHFGFNYLDADYVIFHQANMKMNNQIVKKLKLDPEKVPSCMYKFGNTSSASIPLTIVTQLKDKFETKPTNFLCCGFGVGLSWGTLAFKSEKMIVSELVEVEEPKEESKWV